MYTGRSMVNKTTTQPTVNMDAGGMVFSGFCTPFITGYRNKKVPVYLTIKYPMIEKYFDDEYGKFVGYLIVIKEIKLFRIGTKVEKVPVYGL